MLKTLDLFSGVGGITHALDGIALPKLYCERDPEACGVLEKLMAQGKIPKAPINHDVAKLNGLEYRGKIDMICAGFPCVGMSSAGQREGFDNEQSSLYKHVVRLLKEIQPPFAFLENVPGILTLGIKHVAKTLTHLGYMCWWVVIPAWSVGAKQKRSRWFCLAVKPAMLGKELQVKKYAWFDWTRENAPRMVMTYSKELKARMGMLGNSVVPDCVRVAFLLLWTGLAIPVSTLRTATRIKLVKPVTAPLQSAAAAGDDVPKYGASIARTGVIRSIVNTPQGLLGRPGLRIVLSPTVFKNPKSYVSPEITSGLVTKNVVIDHWATPRRSVGYIGARTLTNRCCRDLGSQLRFARDTPQALRGGYTNPVWAEWLMGFGPNWTASS